MLIITQTNDERQRNHHFPIRIADIRLGLILQPF